MNICALRKASWCGVTPAVLAFLRFVEIDRVAPTYDSKTLSSRRSTGRRNLGLVRREGKGTGRRLRPDHTF